MKPHAITLLAVLLLSPLSLVQAAGGGGGGGGGGGNPHTPVNLAGTDTIPDTTYYLSTSFGTKEKIASITQYNADTTAKRHTVYYINGTINYYALYEWADTVFTKETFYNGSGTMTGYGAMTANTDGTRTYRYYDKAGTLLSKTVYGTKLSALDSSRQYQTYTVYTDQQHIRYKIFYTYSSGGWLLRENHLDRNNDSLGAGTWGWDPLTSTTAYIYRCKNNERFHNPILGQWYDQYRYYYGGTATVPDSLRMYRKDSLLFTVRYQRDTYGWLTAEKYFDAAGTALYTTGYSFDKATSITTRQHVKAPSTPLFTAAYDYRNRCLNSDVYESGTLRHRLKYSYNSGGYLDSVKTVALSGALKSYETYAYYLPYYWTKKYTSFDAAKKMTSYYSYDEYGKVTDSMPFATPTVRDIQGPPARTRIVSVTGSTLILALERPAPVRLSVLTLSGRTLRTVDRVFAPGTHHISLFTDRRLTPGLYIVSGNVGNTRIRQVVSQIVGDRAWKRR